MPTQQELKRLIIQSQFGNYLPLVKAVNYQTVQENGVTINLDFPKITDGIAFYMVSNGYLDYFDSAYRKETLIQKGNAHRQENSVNDTDEDQFFDQVWENYKHYKLEAFYKINNQQSDNIVNIIMPKGSMWDSLIEKNVPELEAKRQKFIQGLEQ